MGRLACWVIVAGSAPTGFRASDPEVLRPTLAQLRRTQPDAVLQWFERGRLWASPAEASASGGQKRHLAAARDKQWRPGGTHRDPKARYNLTRDQKRERFKRRLARKKSGEDGPQSQSAERPKDRTRGNTRNRKT